MASLSNGAMFHYSRKMMLLKTNLSNGARFSPPCKKLMKTAHLKEFSTK